MPDRDKTPLSTMKATSRELDDALEDTFPASDPPSMTSPLAATPSAGEMHQHGDGSDVRVYRVVSMADASDPFGADGNDKGGRWTSPGTCCVYAARTPAGALLEFLAHRDGDGPANVAMAVGVIPATSVLVQSNEPSAWGERPYRSDVRQVGDAWIADGHSHALAVPSALCPDEWNILLNPAHEAHAALRVARLQPLSLDERLAGG
ncbi:MAG TPA: RES family NAD+ phosphorylase [Xanthomonadaceae bacterium]|nr:RES family NAD+ phosphorylase [Xanthomonadaceae bacterium]